MKFFKTVLVGVVVLGASAIASAHVFIPAGTPTGQASAGGRVTSAAAGNGSVTFAFAPSSTDTSVHINVCFDESADPDANPPERMDNKKDKFKAGSVVAGTAQFAIPKDSKNVHWVVLYDEGDDYTYGTEGTITF